MMTAVSLSPLLGLLLAIWVAVPSLSTSYSADESIYRIMFGSCSNPNRGGKIWSLIRSFRPRQLLLLGDQMYTDREVNWLRRTPSPELIRREYEILMRDAQWQELLSSVDDWMAVYDDHDYGVNNGDRTFEFRNESIQLFKKFHPAFEPSLPGSTEPKQGVFSAKTTSIPLADGSTFTYKVVLLDTRSNKDPRGSSNGSFLGEQQWRWLASELSPVSLHDVDLVLVGSPIQVLSDDKLLEENWSEFPAQREQLLDLLNNAGTNVVILSGDIHSAEVSRVRCRSPSGEKQLVELTSSGLSHTFLHRALPEEDDLLSSPIRYKSHGWMADVIGALYQVALPNHYKLHPFADTYRYMHFALLDIVPRSSSAPSSSFDLVLRLINFRGQEVMQRVFPLHREATGHVAEKSHSPEHFQCEPIHGPVPLWRHLLVNWLMVAFALAFVVAPVCFVLYLFVMSIYYVCIGKELKRRQRIEEQYARKQRSQ